MSSSRVDRRSRSPAGERSPSRPERDGDRKRDHRDRERRHHHHHHHHSHHHSSGSSRKHASSSQRDRDIKPTITDTQSILPLPPRPVTLPFDSMPLSKHDLGAYRNTLASYLDIQKQLDIDGMRDEREVRGRWKSFVNKWNRGELAEGWYDPATKRRADEMAAEMAAAGYEPARPADDDDDNDRHDDNTAKAHNDSDSDYGPTPPPSRHAGGQRSLTAGSSGATAEDLALRDELAADQRTADRAAERLARKAERQQQRERLDELAPRAAAGTRERQLEKRAEVAASNRAFAATRESGDVEVRDADLMGDADSSFQQVRREQQRRKTEKELRREEQLRVRQEERERRLRGMRDKEQETMAMFQALVRERHGGQ